MNHNVIGRSSVLGSVDSGMMSVALKIRDRAMVLQDERRKVQAKEPIRLELSQALERETIIHDRRRKELLKCVNERNSIELEIFSIKEEIANHREAKQKAETENSSLHQRLDEALHNRQRYVEGTYGPHQADMDAYIRTIESIVENTATSVERRRLQLEGLRTDLTDARTKEINLRNEISYLRDALARQGTDFHVTESQEDEEITTLSKRIRESIVQRCDLRKKLKYTRNEYNQATEEMLLWEEKQMKSLSKKG